MTRRFLIIAVTLSGKSLLTTVYRIRVIAISVKRDQYQYGCVYGSIIRQRAPFVYICVCVCVCVCVRACVRACVRVCVCAKVAHFARILIIRNFFLGNFPTHQPLIPRDPRCIRQRRRQRSQLAIEGKRSRSSLILPIWDSLLFLFIHLHIQQTQPWSKDS